MGAVSGKLHFFSAADSFVGTIAFSIVTQLKVGNRVSVIADSLHDEHVESNMSCFSSAGRS